MEATRTSSWSCIEGNVSIFKDVNKWKLVNPYTPRVTDWGLLDGSNIWVYRSIFWVWRQNSMVWQFKWNLYGSTFALYYSFLLISFLFFFFTLYKLINLGIFATLEVKGSHVTGKVDALFQTTSLTDTFFFNRFLWLSIRLAPLQDGDWVAKLSVT